MRRGLLFICTTISLVVFWLCEISLTCAWSVSIQEIRPKLFSLSYIFTSKRKTLLLCKQFKTTFSDKPRPMPGAKYPCKRYDYNCWRLKYYLWLSLKYYLINKTSTVQIIASRKPEIRSVKSSRNEVNRWYFDFQLVWWWLFSQVKILLIHLVLCFILNISKVSAGIGLGLYVSQSCATFLVSAGQISGL